MNAIPFVPAKIKLYSGAYTELRTKWFEQHELETNTARSLLFDNVGGHTFSLPIFLDKQTIYISKKLDEKLK